MRLWCLTEAFEVSTFEVPGQSRIDALIILMIGLLTTAYISYGLITYKVFTMVNEESLRIACKNNFSMKRVLEELGLCVSSANYRHFNKKIKSHNIDIGHFSNYVGTKKSYSDKNSFGRYLVENSEYGSGTHQFKKQLIKYGYLKYQCDKCKNDGKWLDEDLSLQLDHINGIRNDNRIENLRILCPNCHSQTATYSGKCNKKGKKIRLCKCGNHMVQKSKLCRKCSNKIKYKIPISKEWLSQLVYMIPMSEIGRIYKVSSNTVRNWTKRLDIDFPRVKAGRPKNIIPE